MGESYEYIYFVDEEPEVTRNGTFLKHGLARIRDRVFRSPIYRPSAIFTFQENDVNAKFWHDTCIANGRKNMLTVIAATRRRSNGAVLIHTELVTKSIREWSKKKPLTTQTVLPSEPFGAAMRGILAGINQALDLKGYAMISPDETYFVNGIAKISIITQGFVTHPIIQFVSMIKDLLQGRTIPLPDELYWFLYFLTVNVNNKDFRKQVHKHPSLYQPMIRLEFRSVGAKVVEFLPIAMQNAVEQSFFVVQFEIKQHQQSLGRNSIQEQSFQWKTYIKTNYPQNSALFKALTPQPSFNVKPYTDGPLSFLRYGRNLRQHPPLPLSLLQVEVELTTLWADFIPSIHEALRINNVLATVYDEMDNVPH